jgi:cell division protein FtsL
VKNKVLLYVMALTLPLSFALLAWQAVRFSDLRDEVERLYKAQDEWVENNKRLITEIASLSSSARIEKIAKDSLGLDKKRPEEVMQITISNR